MAITVRPAGEEDIEILAEMHHLLHDLHRERMPERYKPVETSQVADWFRSRLEKPTVRAWIAEAEGSAVGYLLESDHDRPETVFRNGRRICHLEQLAVLPGFRRRGVAKALLDRSLTEARARRIQDVEGHAWHFNTPSQEMVMGFGLEPQIIRFSRTF